jgi:uncharacterized protein (DUF2461 family)
MQFGLDGVVFACGCYNPDKEQLKRIRQALVDQPLVVKKNLSNKKFRSTFGEMKGTKNKRIPPEFKPYLIEQPLVANKQFYFSAEYPAIDMTRDDLLDWIMEHWETAKIWNQFLIDAMQHEQS